MCAIQMPDGKFRTMLLETVRPGFMFDGYSFKIAQTTIAGTRTPNLQAQRTATINTLRALGHNIALRAAPRPTIVDASHLDLSITSKNHAEPQLSALKVEDSRRKQGKIEYQVRWKGFHSDGDMTWEPATALAGCSALISDFDNKKEKR